MNDFKPIPRSELDAMKAREEAATEGPWEFKKYLIGGHLRGWEVRARLDKTTIKPIIHGWSPSVIGRVSEFINNELNGDFIVHARTDQTYLRIAYQALLAEHEKQRECLREAKVQHRICRVDCVGLGDECDCGASEHNARIDAVLGREGHGVR